MIQVAKIHKVELYIVDINDDFNKLEDYMNYIENLKYAPMHKIISSESKSFEWDDYVVVNYTDSDEKDYENFYKNIK